MNLDTVNLLIPNTDCIKLVNDDYLINSVKTDRGRVISDQLQIKPECKVTGLKNIIHDKLSGETKIELSAKILRENYSDGISENSIENVVHNLNGNNAICFHPDKFIDDAIVLRCDVTDNLIVSRDIAEYISALSLYRINNKYTVDQYRRESIVFRNNAKSYRERMILYDKMSDVVNDKDMYPILARGNRIKDFKNVLRVESNHATFKQMRELFKITKCKYTMPTKHNQEIKYIQLSDVLQSRQKVNRQIFGKITERNVPTLFVNYDDCGLTFKQIEQREGMKSIIINLDCDIQLIKRFIQDRVKGNVSRYVRRYQAMIAEMRQDVGGGGDRIADIVSELKTLLDVA